MLKIRKMAKIIILILYSLQTFSQFPTDRALLSHKFLPSALHIGPTRQTVPEQNFLQLLRFVKRRLVQQLLHHSVAANFLLREQSEVQEEDSQTNWTIQ